MAKKSARKMFSTARHGAPIRLADHDPGDTRGVKKGKFRAAPERYGKELLDLQERLHAESARAVLIVLQGLDTSGKDGTVRHVMRAMNPQGVHVRSFKAPSAEELRHHFLWRFKREIPQPGEITIFNRSYYEDVLVARVKELTSPDVINARYAQINAFEAALARSHVTLVKIYLHISKDEQQNRLMERLDTPEKRYKFSQNDIKERAHWDAYLEAFEVLLSRCTTAQAPWYVVPSDDKDFRNWAIARILLETLREMDPKVPLPKLDLAGLKKELKASA